MVHLGTRGGLLHIKIEHVTNSMQEGTPNKDPIAGDTTDSIILSWGYVLGRRQLTLLRRRTWSWEHGVAVQTGWWLLMRSIARPNLPLTEAGE